MELSSVPSAFAALSQPTRLAAVRLLIAAGNTGMVAGDLGAQLDVRQNTLSANLSVLLHAGLVTNQRQGRTIRYFADLDKVRGLISYLMQDCCGCRPELCQPVLDEIMHARRGGADVCTPLSEI